MSLRRPGLVLLLVLATAVLLGANALSAARALPAALVGAVLALAFLALGRGALRLGGVAHDAPQAYVAGLALAAYLLALPVIALDWSLAASSGLVLALAGLAALWTLRRPLPRDASDGTASLALLGAAGFALIWSLETTLRYARFGQTSVFPLAFDALMHAGVAGGFGDPLSAGRGNPAMADVALPLYHFATYAFPGLASLLLGETPMESLITVWIPLGILATAIGLFILGNGLGGPLVGALSVALLAALPDPASYGLRQGFYSFHWLMEVTPGSLYAMPVGCLSLTLLARWCRAADLRALIASAILLAAMFLLRVHLMVWIAVPWGVAAVLGSPWPGRRLRIAAIVAGFLALPPLLILVSWPDVARMGLLPWMTTMVDAIHRDTLPNGYAGLYYWIAAHFPGLWIVPPLVLLSLACMGGLPLLLLPVLLLWRRRHLEAMDAVPVAFILWAAILTVLAPVPFHGDTSDFRQRGMVFMHALLCCWIPFLVLRRPPAPGLSRALRFAPLVALPVAAFSVAAWKTPVPAWALAFRQMAVAPGLPAAAAWLRREAHPGDTFAFLPLDPTQQTVDDPTILVALAGLPAYMSRPGIQGGAGNARAPLVQTRMDRLAAILDAPDRDAAFRLAREVGVTFLVMRGRLPRWDPSGESATRFDDVAAWRVPGPGRPPA